MITAIQHFLDRTCINAAAASVRSGWRKDGQRERAEAMLASPDFLKPSVSAAQLTFLNKVHFTFPSVLRKAWDTPVARGRFNRAGRDWQRKPAVIFLHGWNGEMGYYCSFPFIQMALAAQGVNALSFELPFHCKRRPREPGEIYNVISDDLETMVDGMRHCLADALSLRLWLREQGCPSVSLWGYSFGGWLAGLLATHADPFAAVVLMNAVARIDLAMATLPFAAPAREGWGSQPLHLEPFNLGNLQPTTQKILILQGLRDLFVPPETLDELAKKWQAELWPMRQAHISASFAAINLWRAARWLRNSVQ